MTIPEMSCQELVELVTEYLEGTLSESDKARFQAHLKECDGCETYLEQMRLAIRALGRLTDTSIPPDAQQKLLMAFRNWKKNR
ncbi:MAG TPA: zf-HC2 domain-containing protein [bacterium]|nr:zf-HC2 domain-containing protein [bacterium]